MLFVHESFVKQVSVLKRARRRSVETTAWKRGSPGEWRLGGEAAGRDAPRVQIHPPAELTCRCNQLVRLLRVYALFISLCFCMEKK